MEDIQAVQQQAINEYNSYVNDSESDSQELLTALNSSVIPTYESYLEQLNTVAPETEEVQNVKAICVEGANKQLEALNKVVEAIQACDTGMLTEADTLIAESESIFSEYENALSVLASDHEISLVSTRSSESDTGEQEASDTQEEASDTETESNPDSEAEVKSE
jgi:prophage DNA circulation protein